MRKIYLFLLFFLASFPLFSQEKGFVRGGVNVDLAFPNLGFGGGGNIDLRYNILDNLNAGIRIGGLYCVHDVVKNQSELTGTLTASILNTYMITSDYYFNYGNNIFAPYLGAGLGFFKVSNLKLAMTDTPTWSNLINFNRETKFGALIRCGVEISKFRLGVEYNFIPTSNLYDVSLAKVGEANNCYLNISLGFYIGGGKWNNKSLNY